jgi:hypothetical protein
MNPRPRRPGAPHCLPDAAGPPTRLAPRSRGEGRKSQLGRGDGWGQFSAQQIQPTASRCPRQIQSPSAMLVAGSEMRGSAAHKGTLSPASVSQGQAAHGNTVSPGSGLRQPRLQRPAFTRVRAPGPESPGGIRRRRPAPAPDRAPPRSPPVTVVRSPPRQNRTGPPAPGAPGSAR